LNSTAGLKSLGIVSDLRDRGKRLAAGGQGEVSEDRGWAEGWTPGSASLAVS